MTDYVLGKNFGYRVARAHKLIERGTVLSTGKDDELIALAFKSGATITEVKAPSDAEKAAAEKAAADKAAAEEAAKKAKK